MIYIIRMFPTNRPHYIYSRVFESEVVAATVANDFRELGIMCQVESRRG